MAGGNKATQQLSKALIPFIHSLATNATLTELDISAHQFGNTCAVSLAKTLQVNTIISTIYWDDNATGIQGLAAIAQALKVFETVKFAANNLRTTRPFVVCQYLLLISIF